MANLFSKSGKTRVIVHEEGIADFLSMNKGVRDMMFDAANKVVEEAQRTADAAQKGSGGRISGYAEAGFEAQWEARGGKRPRINIVSKADKDTAWAAHFHSQLVNGVAHLRAALYANSVGNYKRFVGRYRRRG